MLTCPTCLERLRRTPTPKGELHCCPSCSGRAATAAVLQKTAGADFLSKLRPKPPRSTGEAHRGCPRCSRTMAKVDFGPEQHPILLDVCGPCGIVWFDPGEFQQLADATAPKPPPMPPSAAVPPPIPPSPPAVPPPVPHFARAAPVSVGVAAPAAAEDDLPGPGDDRSAFGLSGPDQMWQYIPALLGMPVEVGPNRLRDNPVLTWSLSVGLVALFAILAAGGGDLLARTVYRWGFIPARWTRHGGLTLLTSFFLHAGWMHVLGNVYFLWVFGDNVEDHLGRGRFVLLLAASHVGGMILHAMVTWQTGVPCVGASAGIAGVLAYYAIAFPRAKIGIFGWLFTLFRVLRMPAVVGLGLYVVLQFVGVARGGNSGVAYLAHLGGLAVGAAVGGYVRMARRAPLV